MSPYRAEGRGTGQGQCKAAGGIKIANQGDYPEAPLQS